MCVLYFDPVDGPSLGYYGFHLLTYVQMIKLSELFSLPYFEVSITYLNGFWMPSAILHPRSQNVA